MICSQFPAKKALILEGGEGINYSELLEAVDRLASCFAKRSVVFILCDNDYPSLQCYLASLKAGVVPLLLNSKVNDVQLQELIKIYDPQYVFMYRDRAAMHLSNNYCLIQSLGSYELYSREQELDIPINDQLAMLLPTSGSTGSPKLVRLSYNNLKSNAESICSYLNIGPDESAVTSLPLSYSYGLSIVNSHLFAGASLVLTNRSMVDSEFWKLIQSHGVTSLAGVPYHFEMLLRLKMERLNIPSVRTITQAGGRLDPEKMRRVYESCQIKGIKFVTMYGQTEASPRISYVPSEDTVRKIGSIGIPIPGGQMWVEKDDGSRVNEVGQVGELIYAGPNVSLGYAESKADLCLGDTNRGVLRTGDLAYFDHEKYFFVQGRKSRFVKVFGLRLALDEVEKMVADMGFVAAAHGTDEKLLVHVTEKKNLSTSSLKERLSGLLNLNHSAIDVRAISDLPRLESGKINYQALKDLS